MQANSTKLRELERLYTEGRFLRALACVVFGALVVLCVVFPLDPWWCVVAWHRSACPGFCFTFVK